MPSALDPATTRQRSAVIALIAASALFGLDTTISAYVLRRVHPADLFLVETSVGTVILWVYMLATGRHRRPARLAPHIALGLIEPGFAYLLFNVGLQRTSAVAGGILISTETIMGVVLGVAILHERLSARAVVALVTGVIGTALVSIGSGGHGHGDMVGNLLVLLAAAGGGFYLLLARRIPASDDVLTGTAYQVLAGWGVAVAFAAVSWPRSGSGLASSGGPTIVLTLATGVLVAVPFLLLNRSLETLAASRAALLLNLVPVFAVVSAVVLLGEPLSVVTVGGGACILAGLTVLGLGDKPTASRSRFGSRDKVPIGRDR
jgi:drug/metabolite transporter (DMT)-like permease